MNYKHLLIAILAGAALVGCNKEKGGENGGTEGNGGNTYVTFNIYAPASDSPATKGAEGTPAFENGSAEEAAIENIRFIFYRNGSKVAVSATDNFTPKAYEVGTVAVSTDPESAFDFQDEATGGSVERVAQARVILKSNGSKPNQVLAFLNMEQKDFKEIADQPTLALALEKMNDETLGSGIKPHNMFINKNNKFVMSNSAYFVGGLASGTPTRAYEIKASAIKDNANEAVNPGDAVTLYVDRVAAKVAVNTTAISGGVVLPTTGDNKIVTSQNKAIKVTPLAWSLNAVQRDVYWTKDISYSPVYNWSLSTADGARQHRTWWAVDPNYNISTGQYGSYFPNSAYEHNSDVATWKLYYYNTNEIMAHSDKKIDGASTLATTLGLTTINVVDRGTANFNTTADYFEKQYCLENTLGTEVANYRRTGTHIIVLAQATVDGNEVDLYRYNNTIYEEADWLDAIVGNVVGIQAAKSFFTCPDADLSVVGPHAFTQLSKTDLKIEKAIEDPTTHKVNKLPSGRKHSDGDVSVFLTDAAKAKTWYVQIADFPAGFDPASDVNDTNWSTYFSKITAPIELPVGTPNPANDLAEAITSVIEPTNAYTLGLLYYCVPVEHLVTKGSTPEVGMYGMVRNHWYDITLDAIKGLGTGIYDPTEPIVPGDKTPDWYLAAKINVNAWHKISQTSSLVD